MPEVVFRCRLCRASLAATLLGASGCYGTLSANGTYRESPGAGVTVGADSFVLGAELGYASHSGGPQPKVHSVRGGLAGGYPLWGLRPQGLMAIPRAYVGVDQSWNDLGEDTTFPLGGELLLPYMFRDWGFVLAPRYTYHVDSDWNPRRSHEMAVLLGITSCLDSGSTKLIRFCL